MSRRELWRPAVVRPSGATRAVCLSLVVLMGSSLAAQPSTGDWSRVERLESGRTVVVAHDGGTASGRFVRADALWLVLHENGAEQRISQDTVRQVVALPARRRWAAAMIGLGAGAALVAAIIVGEQSVGRNTALAGMAAGGVLGATLAIRSRGSGEVIYIAAVP